MELRCEPLDATFGATVTGVDLATLDDPTWERLHELWLEYALLIFGAVMASAFGLIALLFEIRRFFAYGLIVFGAWLSTYMFDIEPGALVALAGGLVSAVGLAMLIRVLARHPVQE